MINLHLEIFIPAVLSLIAHEMGHAAASNRLGDPTARLAGRLSINPLRHASLLGSIIIPIATLTASAGFFMFGWAKPVPIERDNFVNPLRDMSTVALAGPAVNVLLALTCFFFLVFVDQGSVTHRMLRFGFGINSVLAVFNLLPIPPLDGSHIARYLWSKLKRRFGKRETPA